MSIMVNFSKVKETLRFAHKIANESKNNEPQLIYEELLEEYGSQLKEILGDEFWSTVLELQDKQVEINQRLPNVTDEEFEEYVFNNDLLGILLEPLRR